MEAKSFQKQLELWIADAENAIQRLTPPANAAPSHLHAAMRYSLEAGGKRLRPVLCFAAANAFNPAADASYAATALECIHTYSLIHDDLPCMDNSDLRRGRASCHKAFDEATALLAGDALIPLAFKLLAQGYAQDPSLVQILVSELAETAGSQLLVGGQAEDMNGKATGNDGERLEFILRGKTAAMLSSSLVMGAQVGGASAESVEHCRQAGRKAGIAFQLVDDLLDTQGNSAQLGKPVGADEQNNKLTYVNLHGIEATRERIKKLTEESVHHLKSCRANTDFLCQLIRQMSERRS